MPGATPTRLRLTGWAVERVEVMAAALQGWWNRQCRDGSRVLWGWGRVRRHVIAAPALLCCLRACPGA